MRFIGTSFGDNYHVIHYFGICIIGYKFISEGTLVGLLIKNDVLLDIGFVYRILHINIIKNLIIQNGIFKCNRVSIASLQRNQFNIHTGSNVFRAIIIVHFFRQSDNIAVCLILIIGASEKACFSDKRVIYFVFATSCIKIGVRCNGENRKIRLRSHAVSLFVLRNRNWLAVCFLKHIIGGNNDRFVEYYFLVLVVLFILNVARNIRIFYGCIRFSFLNVGFCFVRICFV